MVLPGLAQQYLATITALKSSFYLLKQCNKILAIHYPIQKTEMASITSLPEEILVVIIDQLKIVPLVQLSQTDRVFRRLCDINDPARHGEVARFTLHLYSQISHLKRGLSDAAWKATIVRCYYVWEANRSTGSIRNRYGVATPRVLPGTSQHRSKRWKPEL